MIVAKRVANPGKQRFRRFLLRFESPSGVLAAGTGRFQESEVRVHHIPCGLVAGAGPLVLPSLEELVGEDSCLLWSCRGADQLSRGRRIGESQLRGSNAGQTPEAN